MVDQLADTVTVGCWVKVRDGQLEEGWRIVPPDEADAMRRRISTETPLARALLGRRVGERVRVDGPDGRRSVTILSVG
jgi:transcription elongation factor GreA